MNNSTHTRILLALVLALMVLAPIAVGAGGEPIAAAANCHAFNPNWHMIRTIDATEAGRTVCIYGARAVMPCQAVSPKGLPLRRAVVKPDGRVKCIYGTGA